MDRFLFFILALLYLGTFISFGVSGWLESNDNSEHLLMAVDLDYNNFYFSWFRYVSQFFTGASLLWFFLPAFITICLTGYFIFRLGGLSAFCVFLSSTYVFSILGAGLYAQGLATALFLGVFAVKNEWFRFLLLVLCFFAHSTGIFLCGLYLCSVFINFILKHDFSKIFLSCSTVFGKNNIPSFLTKNLNNQPETAIWNLNLKDLLSFFFKGICFPFIYFGIIGLFSKKRFNFLFFILVSFVGAFLFNARILLFSIPFFCIGFGLFWEKLQYKKLWIFFIFFLCLFQFLNFFSLKILC